MANVDFFVFAGQSNCGRSRTSEMSGPEATTYAITIPQTFIYNPIVSGALQPLEIGVNSRLQNFANADEFGLEASLLKSFSDLDSQNRYMFKYGYGSTDLQFHWNSRRAGSKYDDLLGHLDIVIPLIQAAGDTPVLKAFIWMQGENDATDVNWAADYLTNLTNFFDDFAVDWAAKRATFSLPASDYSVVIGRINGINDPSMVYRDVVRQAEADFCNLPVNNGILIDTDAYAFRDVVHYDATGQIQFGIDVFNTLQLPPAPPNILGNQPNVLVAKSTLAFSEAGINSDNTEIIYLVGTPLKSYKPDRLINSVAGFETGKGYYIVAKTDIDLRHLLIPPIPE